jgi:hypothetical protein
MQMILPIVAGVLILAAFVALYLSRDTWRVYHIIIGFFLLLANATFFYLAARTLDTHRAWRSEVTKFELAYGQQYEENKKLTGELDGRGEVVVDRQEKANRNLRWSIDDWEAELAEAGFGRGRVIATIGITSQDPATGSLSATASEAVTLPKDALVYVFQSQPPREERRLKYKGTEEGKEITFTSPLIVRYLGAHVLTSVNGPKIELAPLYPELRPEVKGPLLIFELAPVDTHEAFADFDEKYIQKLLESPPVSPKVIEQYLKDGDAVDPQKDAKEIVDNAWRRVRFVKAHTVKDAQARPAAAPPAPAALPGDELAPAAEAAAPTAELAAALAAGEMRFQPDDEALFDPQTAEDLVKKGVAQYAPNRPDENLPSHVYMRPLHDYPAEFRNVRNELIATELSIAELDRQIKAIQEAIKLAQESERIRKEEAARRAQDLEKFTFEANTMQKLHDDWAQAAKAAQGEIESLKQSIGARAQQLANAQLKAAQATGRRAAAR